MVNNSIFKNYRDLFVQRNSYETKNWPIVQIYTFVLFLLDRLLVGLENTTQFRPLRLAWYNALSARINTSSASSPGVDNATPKLAVTLA